MSLEEIEVRNFRCIENARVQLDPKCTIISGINSSGKTSFLEAIYTLSCGHSFRSAKRGRLIRDLQTGFQLNGLVITGSRRVNVGFGNTSKGIEVKVAGQEVRGLNEIATLLPVRVIDPNVHSLIEDGPEERRQFVDWGVFHVEPKFALAWRRFRRALKQRNAALNAKLPIININSWDSEFIAAGEIVAAARDEYLRNLLDFVSHVAKKLGVGQIELRHQKGWPVSETLSEALKRSLNSDQKYGSTTIGPHRADLSILIENHVAKDWVSRGQQKMIAATLLLGQISYWQSVRNESACLLIDDLAAELDVDNFQRLLQTVQEIECQLVISALNPDLLCTDIQGRLFHVERGIISRMV